MTLAEYKQSLVESTPSTRRRRNRVQAESQIRKTISHYLTALGIPHTITEAGAMRAKDGSFISGRVQSSFPDLIGVIPAKVSPLLEGRMLAVEVKRADGKLNPARFIKRGWMRIYVPSQQETLEDLRRAGAVALVARSIEDVKEGLRIAEKTVKDGGDLVADLPELE